jgi:hypothetical protein
MLSEFVRQVEPFWPLLAGGLGIVLIGGLLISAWRRRSAWREPIRAYDREQRAIAAFRRRLASDPTPPRQRPAPERPSARRPERPPARAPERPSARAPERSPVPSLDLGAHRQPTRSPTPGE